ncbi:hypothetical protein ACFQY3_05750 [Paenibacillus farraposensis]|uniref:hypothetical protein n=1 Tax=Paenibacillus farraposensis TaxID=2807095 RepID=UPI00361360E2
MYIGNNNKYRSPMPEENCPPASSQNKDIETVYRLALNNPPTAEDFLSHIESGKQYPPGLDCVAASISVFKNKDDVLKQKKKIPVYKKMDTLLKDRLNIIQVL